MPTYDIFMEYKEKVIKVLRW